MSVTSKEKKNRKHPCNFCFGSNYKVIKVSLQQKDSVIPDKYYLFSAISNQRKVCHVNNNINIIKLLHCYRWLLCQNISNIYLMKIETCCPCPFSITDFLIHLPYFLLCPIFQKRRKSSEKQCLFLVPFHSCLSDLKVSYKQK